MTVDKELLDFFLNEIAFALTTKINIGKDKPYTTETCLTTSIDSIDYPIVEYINNVMFKDKLLIEKVNMGWYDSYDKTLKDYWRLKVLTTDKQSVLEIKLALKLMGYDVLL